MSDFFTTMVNRDTKEEVIKLLRDAISSIESGNSIPTNVVIETAPAAFEKGICQDRDSCFFGFAFKKGGKQRTLPERICQPLDNLPQVENIQLPIGRKISSGEIHKFEDGKGYFVCKCGFRTDSERGFKKHYNKCPNRN